MRLHVAETEAGGGGAIERGRDPEALAARVALGDREALAALYDAYREPVTRLCRRLLGSDDAAQDARGEVFLRAREAIASFDARRSFRSWLLAVAAHHCVDQLRRRSLEGRLFEPAELAEHTLPSAAPSPLGAVLARERQRELLAALDALPPRQRAPLVLRYFAELPYAEIATLLGVGTRDVGVLLFRAKLALRKALESGVTR
jgi:RNA polymerase sigma-70 factor (ECF subfamily)